ncbi:16S rRNA (guanine(527)-N(7))-methyltransferase RsmG [Candidatus Babeliales bacterium]|nr:16S rRNA (guanine(527)-N(7))-methyltransferase RsmG [Candidatus Babeliales bacterium]
MTKKLSEQNNKEQRLWAAFKQKVSINDEQVSQFKLYLKLLQEWNEFINLTAVSGTPGIIKRHFLDSLAVKQFVDMNQYNLVVDIGSGAGLPGIPLKIMYPNLKVILLEVNKKRIRFLNTVIEELGLDNIEICDLDFRTFLRTTEAPVDLFLARASLDPVELSRIFKPGCGYKDAKLVYWAGIDFEIDKRVKEFFRSEFEYRNNARDRKLILWGRP